MAKKKLYNTKRKLLIASRYQGGDILSNVRYWWNKRSRVRGYEHVAIFLKNKDIIRVSQDPSSPFYSKDLPRVDLKKVFGTSLRNAKRGTWNFFTVVCNHEGDPSPLDYILWHAYYCKKALKKGIGKVRDHYIRMNRLITRSLEEQLEDALKNHDWYHAMSDSHRVWATGERSLSRIKKLMREVDPIKAEDLWHSYAPEGFTPAGIIPLQRPIVEGDFFEVGENKKEFYQVIKVNKNTLVLNQVYDRESKYPNKDMFLGMSFRVPYPNVSWDKIKYRKKLYRLHIV